MFCLMSHDNKKGREEWPQEKKNDSSENDTYAWSKGKQSDSGNNGGGVS